MSDNTTPRYEALRLCGVLSSYEVFEDGSGVRVSLLAAATLQTVYELRVVSVRSHKQQRDDAAQRAASTVVVVEEKAGDDHNRVRRLSLQTNAPRALFPHALWAVTVSLVVHTAAAPPTGLTYYDVEKWYATPGAEDASVECPCYVADTGGHSSCHHRLGPYSRRQLFTTLATPKGLCAPALSGFIPAAVRGAFLRAKLPNATLGPVKKYFAFAADALAPTMRALQDCMSRGVVREALERSNVQVRRHNGRAIRMIKEMHGGGGGPAARNLLDAYRGVESTVDDFLSAEAQIFGSGVLGVFDLASLAERRNDFWTIQVRTDDHLNPKELLTPTTRV